MHFPERHDGCDIAAPYRTISFSTTPQNKVWKCTKQLCRKSFHSEIDYAFHKQLQRNKNLPIELNMTFWSRKKRTFLVKKYSDNLYFLQKKVLKNTFLTVLLQVQVRTCFILFIILHPLIYSYIFIYLYMLTHLLLCQTFDRQKFLALKMFITCYSVSCVLVWLTL